MSSSCKIPTLQSFVHLFASQPSLYFTPIFSRSLSSSTKIELLFPEEDAKKKKPVQKPKSFFSKIFPWGMYSPNTFKENEGLPTNVFIPNERGMLNFDPSMSVEEHIELTKELPSYFKTECSKYYNEYANKPNNTFNIWNKPTAVRDAVGIRHGEAHIEYDFTSDENFKKWQTGCDSDWSEGYSKCDFYRTDRNTAIFEGTLSSRLVKDGRTKRAGWCSMKTTDKLAFDRKRHYIDWLDFTHLLIKCRGDGRSYKIMLHTPEYFDVTWLSSYSHPLHTHGGPYWQYEMIPFSRFIKTFIGRIQDRQQHMEASRISSVGIVLMDRIDGPFKFELGFVGVTQDVSHKEKFAYEQYVQPEGIFAL